MKYPDLNSAKSYLFTLEWRKYFWVFDLFGSFIQINNVMNQTSEFALTDGCIFFRFQK